MNAKVSDFLLAGRRLQTSAIVNLLISSSFGLNAIFYAAWLGYSIGMWAILIQVAWSISFFLLIPASKHFKNIVSLHDFLGQRFGYKTKLLAALCSLIGVNYFVAWEVAIDASTISPFVPNSLLIVGIFALITICYTLLFGLRGNASISKYINSLKIFILLAICGVAIHQFMKQPSSVIYQSMFPPFSKVVANIGIFGLITNIIFNLSWQFVDNSSWQSIIGGAKASDDSTRKNLIYSGMLIFFVVNFLSTMLGIFLAQITTITPDNILSMTSVIMPQYSNLISAGIVLLSIASMMSLVDGMLLTFALTINMDILPERWLAKLNEEKRMRLVQVSIVVFGLLAIGGIELILKGLDINLFDFVYVIVISQLSLLGPVVLGLYTKGKKNEKMWIAILLALIVGFGSVIIGGMTENKMLIDGAGTFSAITSLLAAWVLNRFL